jgi:hypothetical protein
MNLMETPYLQIGLMILGPDPEVGEIMNYNIIPTKM